MIKRIIFLDIDGVLTSYLDMHWIDDKGPRFVESAVYALNKLIEFTNSDICISSAWRKGKNIEMLQDIMDSRGVNCKVIGKTNSLDTRGNEILKWLDDNPEYEEYIIIDDEMSDIINTIPYYWKTHICTNPYRCLDIYDIGKHCREIWPELPNYKNRTLKNKQN